MSSLSTPPSSPSSGEPFRCRSSTKRSPQFQRIGPISKSLARLRKGSRHDDQAHRPRRQRALVLSLCTAGAAPQRLLWLPLLLPSRDMRRPSTSHSPEPTLSCYTSRHSRGHNHCACGTRRRRKDAPNCSCASSQTRCAPDALPVYLWMSTFGLRIIELRLAKALGHLLLFCHCAHY